MVRMIHELFHGTENNGGVETEQAGPRCHSPRKKIRPRDEANAASLTGHILRNKRPSWRISSQRDLARMVVGATQRNPSILPRRAAQENRNPRVFPAIASGKSIENLKLMLTTSLTKGVTTLYSSRFNQARNSETYRKMSPQAFRRR